MSNPNEITLTAASAAVCTLQKLGYAYKGGSLWEPPLGTHQESVSLSAAEQRKVVMEAFDLIEYAAINPTDTGLIRWRLDAVTKRMREVFPPSSAPEPLKK